MTDGPTPPHTGATPPPNQTQGQGQAPAPIMVNAQYVKDLSFENPGAPKMLMELKEAPDVNVNVDVKAQKYGDNVYEVSLVVEAKASHKNETVFVVECTYAGVFTLNNIPEDQVQPVLLVECPRLLFPYARAVVSDATREGGFAPLMIAPIDFAGLYLQQQQQGGADTPGSDGGASFAGGSAPAATGGSS